MSVRPILLSLFVVGLVGASSAAWAKPARVELLDAGKGNKTKLRLHPKKGLTTTTELSMGMTMSVAMGGMQMPATDAPTTIIILKSKIEDVAKNGNIIYSFVFEDVRLEASNSMPPGAVSQMRAATKELVGTKGRATITNTGRNLGAKFDLPDSLSAGARQTLEGMRNSIEQIASPLPDEAVGVGASWKVLFETEQMGINVSQNSVYTLTSVKGSRVQMKAVVKQKAASSSATLPNLPPGVEARLVSLDSTGDAAMTLELAEALPVAGRTKVKMTMDAEMTAGGQTQKMTMGMDLDVKLTRR